MRRFLIVATIAAIMLVPAGGSAQEPGSAGGTIGKQGRSASGGEAVEVQRSAPAPSSSGASQGKPSEAGGSSCAKVVGVWKGPLDYSTFKSNGTVTSPSFPTEGPWTCRNGQLVIAWKDWGIDRCSLTRDGRQMNCRNETLGNTFSRVRTGGK